MERKQLDISIRECEQLQTLVWRSLVHLAERQQAWDDAAALIQAAEKESGDGPQIRLIRARNLAIRHGAKAIPQIKQLLENTESFSAVQRAWLWRNIAAIAYELHDYPLAVDLSNRVLEAEPDNLALQRLRFQIAAAQSDADAMQIALDQIQKIEQRPSAFWHYGQALRLILVFDEGGNKTLLQQALDHLDQASRLRSKWGQVNLLAAMVHERLGNDSDAIKEYLEAIELGVASPDSVRRAAQLLIRSNRLRDADRMFRLLAEREPTLSEEMGREERFVKAQLGQFDAALKPARKIAASSDNIDDHIWLGQLLNMASQRLRSQGRLDEADKLLKEAEATFKHAVILKSDSPEPWVALIQFYVQSDQIDKAKKKIEDAQLQLAPSVAAAALGQCYDALNQTDKANEQYALAIRNAPDDPIVAQAAAAFYTRTNQLREAQDQLVRIIEGRVDSNKEQKSQARRSMAILLAGQGGPQNRQEALRWLKENLTENPDSRTDQYLKAVVLADDATGRGRPEAIASLEKLLATQRNPDPEIQFTLAQLYLTDGNWRDYKLRMDTLLKTHRNVPRYLIAHAGALIQRKDYHEAELCATELAKLVPDDIRTTAIRAELAFQQRQFERARKLLTDYLKNSPAERSGKEKQLPLVARTLESYAKRLRDMGENARADAFSKEASEIYQKYVDMTPGNELLMASFLSRQERFDEAIDLIDTLWETSDPNQIARACFSVIDRRGATPEHMQRVDNILQKATEQHPNALVIQIAIAVLRNLQERFEDAEAIYRGILRKAPDNPTALNNLAVLLARHGVKLNEAASLIDRAIQKAGPTGELLDSRAIVQLALNHPERALEDLRKAIAESPTPMRFFHLAEAFHANGQRKEAVQAFDQAVEMGLREQYLQGVERRKFKKLEVLLK